MVMYIGNRRYTCSQPCEIDKCNKKPPCPKPPKPPCNIHCERPKPYCVFEIKCTPFDDQPPQIRFELKI